VKRRRAQDPQRKRLSFEERYRRGDKRVLMQELHLCLAEEKPVPKWLRSALLRAVMQATFFDIDYWDDVFGPPCVTDTGRPARGKTRTAMQKKQLVTLRIYDRIEQLKAEGTSVDKRLFEKVAAEIGVGRAQVEQLYYDNRASVREATEAVQQGTKEEELK
jgi:hypothetical protein